MFNGRFDKQSSWQHTIVRFQSPSGAVLPIPEATAAADKFCDTWESVNQKASNYSCLVWHGYGRSTIEDQAEDEKDYAKVCHVHILWKYYKGSPLKQIIVDWVQRLGLICIWSSASNAAMLTQYLLQGKGRQVLCKTGNCTKGEVHGGTECVQEKQEAAKCEDYIWRVNLQGCSTSNPNDSNYGRKSFGPHQTNGVRKANLGVENPQVEVLRKLEELMLSHRVKDEQSLSKYLTGEDKDWFDEQVVTQKEWNKMFLKARDNAMATIQKMSWEDIMRTYLPDDPTAYYRGTMSITRSLRVITQIMDAQGWNSELRMQFLRNIYAVMNNNLFGKKRNTLYLIGTVSSGKSMINKSLCTSALFYFSTGEYNARSSDFHFEDMVGTRVTNFKEPQIEAGKVDKMKVIMGGEDFDTSVKFKVKGRVDAVPILIDSNNEIWRYAPQEKEALEERCYKWWFNNNINDKVAISGAIHPKAWLKLIEYYGITRSDVVSDDESDFDLSTFGGKSQHQAMAKELNEAIAALEEDESSMDVDPPDTTTSTKRTAPDSDDSDEELSILRNVLTTPQTKKAKATPAWMDDDTAEYWNMNMWPWDKEPDLCKDELLIRWMELCAEDDIMCLCPCGELSTSDSTRLHLAHYLEFFMEAVCPSTVMGNCDRINQVAGQSLAEDEPPKLLVNLCGLYTFSNSAVDKEDTPAIYRKSMRAYKACSGGEPLDGKVQMMVVCSTKDAFTTPIDEMNDAEFKSDIVK